MTQPHSTTSLMTFDRSQKGTIEARPDIPLGLVRSAPVQAGPQSLSFECSRPLPSSLPVRGSEHLTERGVYLGRAVDVRAEYPMVAARLTAPAGDIGAVSEERFGVALGCLLDGLEARARTA
jgi:hypothetical protein